MAKVITFFSHKGGVGKTTTAHNVAVALTKLGKNVLLIDADSQMNLTSSVLGLSDSVEYADVNESKWSEYRRKFTNIHDYLNWYTTRELQDIKFNINLFDYQHPNFAHDINNGKLTLLLGDVNIFNLETKLYSIVTNRALKDDATIFNIQEGIKSLANYQGRRYDFILVDTSPSASSILNGVLVMMSDYFLCPLLPNFFSLQAIDNITEIMRNWVASLDDFRKTTNRRGLNFEPKFLGIIINKAKRFKQGDSTDTTIYAQQWRDKINISVDRFYRYAMDNNRTLSKDEFIKIFSNSLPFIISEVCDFTGQICNISEATGVPVLDLTNDIIKDGSAKGGLSPFSITSNKEGDKKNHYQKAFAELTESYTYIASSFINLK
jgi:chromosome partitioning protein